MRLAEQWRRTLGELPEHWADARLVLVLEDQTRAERAAALLGPATPGRFGRTVRFFAARRGAGIGPDALERLLRRLDDERIEGTLELVSSGEAPAEPVISRQTLAESWDAGLATLPSDWSDVYAELELRSTDHLEPAALLLAPVNPSRFGGTPGFRFRSARQFGYGASPGMVRRCLERLDDDGIPGEVRIVHALSDTRPVGTQGPVWYVGGKAV